MSVYEKAIELYKHQHDRWNHWALFFFGLIASVFVIRNNAQQEIPIWIAAFLALVISCIWVAVAQSIRATTHTWLELVKKLEGLPEEKRDDFELFKEFEKELEKYRRFSDLRKTAKIWTAEPYRRVTRLVSLVGLLTVAAFFVLFIHSCVRSFQEHGPLLSEKRENAEAKEEAITRKMKEDRMLEQALFNGGIGLVTGVIGSFIGFTCWPWFRRRKIWKKMRVVAEPYPGFGGFWCRVVNGSPFNMGKAIAYITITHEVDDILDPPSGRTAFIERRTGGVLRYGQLCLAVQELGANPNPMRVDIYSGEMQPLAFGCIENSLIEIVSEKCHSPARVFLVRKAYKGTLTVVCMDCQAREFPFEIDPDASLPIKFST